MPGEGSYQQQAVGHNSRQMRCRKTMSGVTLRGLLNSKLTVFIYLAILDTDKSRSYTLAD